LRTLFYGAAARPRFHATKTQIRTSDLCRASPKNGERKSFDRIARELAAIGARYEAEGKTDSAK
jgi:hypothetical protein